MSKSKSRKHAAKHEPIDELVDEPPLAMTTSLTSVDLIFLQRVVRFLVNVLDPGYAGKARREGYSSKEHALGWQIWRTAAGETRPFEHWLRAPDVSDGDVDGTGQRQRLQEIDDFENRWFPRTRAIIRRVVPKDRRDGFAAAFFKDLVQQPLGPAVVGSVGTYLARIEGLEASAEEDAKAVRELLRSRGLTAGRIEAIKDLLKEAQMGVEPRKKDGAVASAAELEKARTAQREAVGSLRDWFNDWATTLRPCFDARDQIRLGLMVARGKGPAAEDEENDAGEGSA